MANYFDDKVCSCPGYGYYADNVCIGCRQKHPTELCDPPACRHCGGWPKWPLDKCPSCRKDYYRWFEFLLPTGKQLLCWDCSVKFHGTVPHGARRPPASVLIKAKPLSEITAGLNSLLENW